MQSVETDKSEKWYVEIKIKYKASKSLKYDLECVNIWLLKDILYQRLDNQTRRQDFWMKEREIKENTIGNLKRPQNKSSHILLIM